MIATEKQVHRKACTVFANPSHHLFCSEWPRAHCPTPLADRLQRICGHDVWRGCWTAAPGAWEGQRVELSELQREHWGCARCIGAAGEGTQPVQLPQGVLGHRCMHVGLKMPWCKHPTRPTTARCVWTQMHACGLNENLFNYCKVRINTGCTKQRHSCGNGHKRRPASTMGSQSS